MSEKRFPPSARRLAKLRKDGKVVKSPMVSIAVSYWIAVIALPLSLSWVGDKTLIQWLNYKLWSPMVAFEQALWTGMRSIVILVAALALGAVIAEVTQTRGLFLPSQLIKGFNRSQPGAYLGRVKQSLVDTVFGLLRCIVLVLVFAPIFFALIAQSIFVFDLSSEQAIATLSDSVYSLVYRGGFVLIVFAIISYSMARWKFSKQNRMSLHELKEEHKEGEGDPHVKAARRHEHMVLVMSELERRVKRSKVIVVRRAPEKP